MFRPGIRGIVNTFRLPVENLMPSPLTLSCRVALLDIEGTVSPLAFVRDVMFPFAAERLESFVSGKWCEPAMAEIARQVACDTGETELLTPAEVVKACRALMARDAKATGLKALQGLIWDEGFRSGALRPPLFEDVPETLKTWRQSGIDLAIYSSGSIGAQIQFFRHAEAGDLTPLFSRHFDTTTGPKKVSASYSTIAGKMGLAPNQVAFFSDIVEELDAARHSGMVTVLAERPGNPPVSANGHPAISDFWEIEWGLPGR